MDPTRSHISSAFAAQLALTLCLGASLVACRGGASPEGSQLRAAEISQGAAGEARPPNVILIFTDDQGFGDLSCYGSEKIATPHLDGLAREGARFTNFYSASPVCSPSRAALLTGCYPQRVGVTSVLWPEGRRQGLHPNEVTIAEVLKERGYATACVGKWHLGDDAMFLPTRQGFDSYYGIPYSNDMSLRRGEKSGPPLMRDEQIVEHPAVQATLTKRYTEEAVRFIEANRAQPFFLYLPHTMPHVPLAASEEFRGKSRAGLYGDVIEEIDASVGTILRTLARLELEEDTLVVFTSDNGPWLNRGAAGGSAGALRDGKFSVFEGGMRVPCLMRLPGKIPAGSRCDAVTSTIDLLPTFARLAGASPQDTPACDGLDLTRVIAGTADAAIAERAFFYGFDAVRVGKWKLLRRARSTVKARPVGALPLLFDLESDVGETENLAAQHPELVKELQRRLAKHRSEVTNTRRPIGQAKPPKVGPRILLIGDSISMGYTNPVRNMLWGKAQVYRPMLVDERGNARAYNCAGTDRGIAEIDGWLAAQGGAWDAIHFNFGLHDLKRVHPETGKNSNDPAHPRQTEVDEYRTQLTAIVDKLQATGAKLIFATTTPYPSGVKPRRDPVDAERYNAVALELVRARGIAVNDLHGFVAPRLSELQRPRDVHFHRRGSQALAEEVVKQLRALVID